MGSGVGIVGWIDRRLRRLLQRGSLDVKGLPRPTGAIQEHLLHLREGLANDIQRLSWNLELRLLRIPEIMLIHVFVAMLLIVVACPSYSDISFIDLIVSNGDLIGSDLISIYDFFPKAAAAATLSSPHAARCASWSHHFATRSQFSAAGSFSGVIMSYELMTI